MRRWLPYIALVALMAACGPPPEVRTVRSRLCGPIPCYYGDERDGDEWVAFCPVMLSRSVTAAWPEGREPEGLTTLLTEANAYLRALPFCRPVMSPDLTEFELPVLYAGDAGTPAWPGELIADPVLAEAGLDPAQPLFAVHVTEGSRRFCDSLRARCRAVDVNRCLYVELCAGMTPPGEFTDEGDAMVDMGTGWRERVPAESLRDGAVEVIGLRGALMDDRGRVLRAGCESIAIGAGGPADAFSDAPYVVTSADVARALTLRREDLPGAPLALHAALANLVANLTGRRGMLVVPTPLRARRP